MCPILNKKQQQQQQQQHNVEKCVMSSNWLNRPGLLQPRVDGVTTYLEQRHLLYKMNSHSHRHTDWRHWERSDPCGPNCPRPPSPASTRSTVCPSVFHVSSRAHEWTETCCRANEISRAVSSHSPGHALEGRQSALTAAPHYYYLPQYPYLCSAMVSK